MIKKFFAPGDVSCLTGGGLLALRLFFGLTMLLHHGLDKLNNFSAYATKFPDPIGIGVKPGLALVTFAETAGALMLVLGLFTRFGALTLVIDMAVAFFMVHKSLQGGELAFLYLGAYVALLLAGGGKFSVDKLLFGKGK